MTDFFECAPLCATCRDVGEIEPMPYEGYGSATIPCSSCRPSEYELYVRNPSIWAEREFVHCTSADWHAAEEASKQEGRQANARLSFGEVAPRLCRALISFRDTAAQGLNSTERMLLRSSPGLLALQRDAKEHGLIVYDDDEMISFTNFARELLRVLPPGTTP